MKKFKLLIGAVVMALALVLVAMPAHAGSSSLAVAVDLIDVDVSNFNIGGIGNFIYTGANSGMNFTMFGGSNTGNASSGASVSSALNSNSTAVVICDFESGPVAVNLGGGGRRHGHRGPCWPFRCYDRVALAVDLTKVEVNNFNAGLVINGVHTVANSGFNMTFGGDSMTGNANASAGVSTVLNSNSTSVVVVEGGMGPAAFNFGGRHALAVALEADLVRVNNVNLGLVANFVSTRANTGFNATIFGSSDTGDAAAGSSVANAVNSNSTSVMIADGSSGPVAANVSHMGGPVMPGGGPMAANIGTSGVAVAAEVDAVEVSNVNVGGVYNDVETSANTGHNLTVGCPEDPCDPEPDPCGDPCDPEPDPCGGLSGSCGGGSEGTSSDTGDASATSTVSNTVNSNSTSVVIGGGAL